MKLKSSPRALERPIRRTFLTMETRRKKRILFLLRPEEIENIQNPAGSLVFSIKKEEKIPMEDIRQQLPWMSTLVLSDHLKTDMNLAEILCEAHLLGLHILTWDAYLTEQKRHFSITPSNTAHLLTVNRRHQDWQIQAYQKSKDWIEPVLAFLLLALLSPVLVAVALLVRFTSPGPVLYRQTRIGLKGQSFDILKFRSMRTDAEKNGPQWSGNASDHARMTPIGHFLRASHLDELPQLWNVVRGELGFIGPRPERPIFAKQISVDFPYFHLRTLVKPGITGWAQTQQGYANSMEDSKRKLEYDLFYILRRSPALDTQIILKTISTILGGGTEGKKAKADFELALHSGRGP